MSCSVDCEVVFLSDFWRNAYENLLSVASHSIRLQCYFPFPFGYIFVVNAKVKLLRVGKRRLDLQRKRPHCLVPTYGHDLSVSPTGFSFVHDLTRAAIKDARLEPDSLELLC